MMTNSFPQPVTDRAGEAVIFLVYGLTDAPSVGAQVADVCANFSALVRSMHNRYPDAHFSATIGFGAEAWGRLFPTAGRPRELTPFEAIVGPKHTAVSTPGDLFFHLRADQMGLCHEFAAILDQKLSGAVRPIDETHGFRFRNGRAIIGFVDGTENPAVDEDPWAFAVVGDEDPDFAGGSYAFVQKYVHDMVAWNALTTEQQERVIGRRKFDDVELSDEEKPSNAHNALSNVGDDKKIVRSNIPFAHTSRGEYGTYFIGYASTFSTTRLMLERMFLGDPAGNSDRLLDFSTPTTGTLFFVPSFDLLGRLGDEA